MKKVSILAVLGIAYGLLTIFACGCVSTKAQPGETAAEVRRRHQRVSTINSMERRADTDKFWMLDEPSKLGDTRIP